MKKMFKYLFVSLLIFLTINNISAATIKETVNSGDSYDTLERNTTVIGVTKFTSNEVITAGKATKAGANDATLYVKQNGNIEGYQTPVIYIYYGPIGGWYSLDENNNATYITDAQTLDYLTNNLKIYFVNNVEKKINISFNGDNLDLTKLPSGITYKDKTLYVNSSLTDFELYTTNNKKINFFLDKNLFTYMEDTSVCYTISNGYITNYDSTCSSEVVIPSKINGVDIIGIDDKSFNNKEITNVVIPETIMNIGNNSFSNNDLESVTILEKYDSTDFITYGTDVFGEFSNIKYENELTRLLDLFPNELTVKVAKKSGIEFSSFDEGKIGQLVLQKKFIANGFSLEYELSRYKYKLNNLYYANAYEGEEEDTFYLVLQTYLNDELKEVYKTISFEIEYVETPINPNVVMSEINGLYEKIYNDIMVEGIYSTPLSVTNDLNKILDKYEMNAYSYDDYGIGDGGGEEELPEIVLSDSYKICKTAFLEKDGIIYSQFCNEPFHSILFSPNIDFNNYNTVDEFIDAVLEYFENKTKIHDYEIQELNGKKYDESSYEDESIGLYKTYYDIILTDKNTSNMWVIRLHSYSDTGKECGSINGETMVCKNVYLPNISIDDYDDTLSFISAGIEKFKTTKNITNYKLENNNNELGYSTQSWNYNSIYKIKFIIDLIDLDTNESWEIKMSKPSSVQRHFMYSEYETMVESTNYQTVESFVDAILDQFSKNNNVEDFDLQLNDGLKYIRIGGPMGDYIQIKLIDLDTGDEWRIKNLLDDNCQF